MGYLDVVAGVGGLFKMVLVIKYKKLLLSLNFVILNFIIDFVNSFFYVNIIFLEWNINGIFCCVGVSFFGVGGINVYVVFEEVFILELFLIF